MSVYYSDEYLTNHDYLQHYGKKGMKWGVVNTPEPGSSNGFGGGGGIQDLDTAIAEKEKHCKQILARMEGMDKSSPMYNKAKQAYYKELNALKGLQNKKAAQGTKEVYRKLAEKAKNDSVKGKIEKALGVEHNIKKVDSKGMSIEEFNKQQHDSSISGKLDNAGKAIKKKAKKVKKAAKDTVKKTTKEVKAKAKEAKKKVEEWLDW